MYKQSFINKVEEVYGKDSKIAQTAREGAYILGRYLDDNQNKFTYHDILNKNPAELHEMAIREKAKAELYSDWVSCKAYRKDALRINYCPINYLQNCCADNRYEMSEQICKGVGYVGYYPRCKMWGRKDECWKKFDELSKSQEELK